jgi:hypothetical protein
MGDAAMEAPTRGSGAHAVNPIGRFRDDRGRTYAFDRHEPKRSARRRAIHPGRIRAAYALQLREALGRLLVALLYVATAGLLILVIFGGLPAWPSSAAMAGLFVVPIGATLLLSHPITARVQRRAGRALGLCPACGYSIAEIERQEDACRVCPECGGAWKLDEDTSPPPR